MLKKIAIILLFAILLIAGGFIIWAESALPAMPEALQSLKSVGEADVNSEGWIICTPKDGASRVGYIFYPGGRVDYRAYAPACVEIASHGYDVFLVRMPLNLAVFGANQADDIIAANPEITTWVIGGHSLGGTMAASYAYRNPDHIKGLVLLASYPVSDNDLSTSGMDVAVISASEDGLATREEIISSLDLLPPDTEWTEIQGGNHAQMGWYGSQPGDNQAMITRQAQQKLVVEATLQLLDRITP